MLLLMAKISAFRNQRVKAFKRVSTIKCYNVNVMFDVLKAAFLVAEFGFRIMNIMTVLYCLRFSARES